MTESLGLAPHATEAAKHRGHPLFPRPETESGPDPRNIDLIHVERWLLDGTKEVCPVAFRASEIRSWEDIVARFGGQCTYQLRAQCASTYRWQGSTEKVYFGSPAIKPLSSDPGRPKAAQARGAAAPIAPAPSPIHPGTVPAAGGAPSMGYAPAPMHYSAPFSPPSSDLAPLLHALIKSTSEVQGMILQAMLEARTQRGPSPLELIRELRPILEGSGGAGALLQGVEIAKAIFQGPQNRGAPPSDDLASSLEALLRPKAHPPAGQAAAPAAAVLQGGAAPWTPLPGWPPWYPPPWVMPPFGWPGAPAAPARAAPYSSPADAVLRTAMLNPAMGARLAALLATASNPTPAAGAAASVSPAAAAAPADAAPARADVPPDPAGVAPPAAAPCPPAPDALPSAPAGYATSPARLYTAHAAAHAPPAWHAAVPVYAPVVAPGSPSAPAHALTGPPATIDPSWSLLAMPRPDRIDLGTHPNGQAHADALAAQTIAARATWRPMDIGST